jgi:hypothetical protein
VYSLSPLLVRTLLFTVFMVVPLAAPIIAVDASGDRQQQRLRMRCARLESAALPLTGLFSAREF